MRHPLFALLAVPALFFAACGGGQKATPSPTVTEAPSLIPLAPGQVRLTYYGHAMFTIESPGGVVILTDPNQGIGYRPPSGPIDIVTVSHEHFDHNAVEVAPGARALHGLDKDGACIPLDETFGDVRIRTLCTFHDNKQGASRGANAMFVFDIGDFRLLHAGDLGHPLTEADCCPSGRTHVLLLPVGGHFTIGPAEADEVISYLNPNIVVPMHYRTDALRSFPDIDVLSPLDDFLQGKTNVRHQDDSALVLAGQLQARPVVIVLDFQAQ